tara:strand:- start:402 stop:962 length:561 start_codon:yes stop_codon:yes gene_type:complete
MDFACVEDCSQCCVERDYYPSKKFGKVGVLILPEEKEDIKSLAKKHGLEITILPRIGISNDDSDKPTQIIAYQMMGKETNGNTCPFLDTETQNYSPHGGFPCKIYQNRPLACKAYPVIESSPITLDSKCKFCQENGSTDKNLNSELESLVKIKNSMNTNSSIIWRFATSVGEDSDQDVLESGWFLE